MNIRVNTPLKHGGEIIPAGTIIAPGGIELSQRDMAALIRARAVEPTKDDPSPGYEGETKAKNTNTQGRSGTAREAPSTSGGTQPAEPVSVGTQSAAHSSDAPVQPDDQGDATKAEEGAAGDDPAPSSGDVVKPAEEKTAAGQADKPKRGGKTSES